jgi:hypothetical protein
MKDPMTGDLIPVPPLGASEDVKKGSPILSMQERKVNPLIENCYDHHYSVLSLCLGVGSNFWNKESYQVFEKIQRTNAFEEDYVRYQQAFLLSVVVVPALLKI